MKEIIAQILGIVFLLCMVIAMQAKNKKIYLIFNLVGNLMYIVNLILLGAITGAIASIVSVTQLLIITVYTAKTGKDDVPKWLIWVFVATSLASTIPFAIMTEGNIIKYLPIFNSMVFISTIALRNMKYIRVTNIILQISGTVYNLNAHAYTAILTNALVAVSSIIGLIRYRKDKKKEDN